jgi:hypothetical protein
VSIYRLGGLMPGLVLGLIPYALSLIMDNGTLLLFGVLHTLAAGGDWLVLWLLRGVGPGALVEDHPTRAGCYVLEPEPTRARATMTADRMNEMTHPVDSSRSSLLERPQSRSSARGALISSDQRSARLTASFFRMWSEMLR